MVQNSQNSCGLQCDQIVCIDDYFDSVSENFTAIFQFPIKRRVYTVRKRNEDTFLLNEIVNPMVKGGSFGDSFNEPAFYKYRFLLLQGTLIDTIDHEITYLKDKVATNHYVLNLCCKRKYDIRDLPSPEEVIRKGPSGEFILAVLKVHILALETFILWRDQLFLEEYQMAIERKQEIRPRLLEWWRDRRSF